MMADGICTSGLPSNYKKGEIEMEERKIALTSEMVGEKAFYEYNNSNIVVWKKDKAFVVGFTLNDPIFVGTLKDVVQFFEDMYNIMMGEVDY